MNFLAHLHLAGRSPESRLGNLLGDFVRGRPDDRFPREIWQGIMMHRHLDAYTDRHPAWKRSKARLKPERRRFAGIIVDIFYDHFLAGHWGRFSQGGESLEEFLESCHDDLESGFDRCPAEAQEVFRRMIRQGWLASYREIGGIEAALDRTSKRSEVFGPVRKSIEDLDAHYDEIETDFLDFYPDAIEKAAELRDSDLL